MAWRCDVRTNRLDMMRMADVTDDYYCRLCIVQPTNQAMSGCYVRAMDLEIQRSAAVNRTNETISKFNLSEFCANGIASPQV